MSFLKGRWGKFWRTTRIDDGNPIGRVDVEILDEGTAMVSWMEGIMIKAARVHANGTIDSSLTVASTSDSRSSGFPQMTKSGEPINLCNGLTTKRNHQDSNFTIILTKLLLYEIDNDGYTTWIFSKL